jgi:hypothetical protein
MKTGTEAFNAASIKAYDGVNPPSRRLEHSSIRSAPEVMAVENDS